MGDLALQGCELKSDITNFKMLLTKSVQKLFRPTCKLLRASKPISCRTLTHYPIDDVIFGLTDDERQLREMAFNFCQKELAPLADKMDKTNEFPEMREVWKKWHGCPHQFLYRMEPIRISVSIKLIKMEHTNRKKSICPSYAVENILVPSQCQSQDQDPMLYP